VESVLRETEQAATEFPHKAEIIEKLSKKFAVDFRDILSGSRERRVGGARAEYCYLAREQCQLSGKEISKELILSSGGLSRLVARGKTILMPAENK